jgi:hypothetical protein
MGISAETLQNGLRSFPGLAHRMEQVGRRGNVLFVNDSKGTNADAAGHALSSFGEIFWIAGGKPKAGGITGLKDYFPRIKKAYLIGRARRGGIRARRSRRAALAGLRLLRPVPQFRNPRRRLPRPRHRAIRREAGGVRHLILHCHGRACPGHPRLSCRWRPKM